MNEKIPNRLIVWDVIITIEIFIAFIWLMFYLAFGVDAERRLQKGCRHFCDKSRVVFCEHYKGQLCADGKYWINPE